MQTLDLMTLDPDSHLFDPKNLALSSMLLILAVNFEYATLDTLQSISIS